MGLVDCIIAAGGVIALLLAGFGVRRRRRRETAGEFILGGRRLRWLVAGTAMVAAGSNADSPLHQSGKIRTEGLTGAWFYWSQMLATIGHALVFGRLWRRAGLTTVVEFYDLRYAGRGAKTARTWSLVFGSLMGGVMTLAVGLLAMIKICQVLLGLHAPVNIGGLSVAPEVLIVVGGMALGLSYSVVSGLLGVVAGNVVEFLIATGGAYILMFLAYREVGYGEGLRAGLAATGDAGMLTPGPVGGVALVVFIAVLPFAGLAQSNALNQQFLAVHDERNAVLSGLWRVLHHYFVRAWPWYVCGLCAVVLLPALPGEEAYPGLIQRLAPEGLRGLMFAGFLVAFMSSAGGAMHTAGVTFVNDFYRLYVVTQATDRHYVWAMRVSMAVIAALATAVALMSKEILGLVQVALSIVAASGLVMLLRWFWWRVNSWADLAAQMVATPIALFFAHDSGAEVVRRVAQAWGAGGGDDRFAVAFLLTFAVTTGVALTVMWLTPAESPETLARYYRLIRPYGFWRPVAARCPEVTVTDSLARDLRHYLCGVSAAAGLLAGTILLLLGRLGPGLLCLASAVALGAVLVRALQRQFGARDCGASSRDERAS